MLYGLLGRLENSQVWDTITKEVVGINAPKIAFTRTWDERLDVATSEIGNTVAAFGVGYLADLGLKAVFKKFQAEGAGRLQKNWAVLGRSGAMYSTIFALMWAMPFIRNYLTTKRTGTVKFTDVIGAGQQDTEGKQADRETEVRNALSEFKRRTLAILGMGAAAAGFFTVTGRIAAARKWSLDPFNLLFKPWMRKNMDLLLEKGEFQDFGGLKALLFWGVPSYSGCIQASRDPTEKTEQKIKFLNFVVGFSGISLAMKSYFNRKFESLGLPSHLKALGISGKAGEEALTLKYATLQTALRHVEATQPDSALAQKLKQGMKLWRKRSVLSLGGSLIALGSLPQLLNIYLTKRRLARQRLARRPNPPVAPSGGLIHKNFAQYTHIAG